MTVDDMIAQQTRIERQETPKCACATLAPCILRTFTLAAGDICA